MDMRQQQRGREPSFEEAVDIADEVRQWRRERRKVIAMRVVAALLIILAIGIGGFPTFLQYQSARELRNTSDRSAQAVAGWPQDGGQGIDDLTLFITSEGEVLVYAGSDPSNADDWSLRLRGSRFSARLKTRSPKCRAARSPVNLVLRNQIAPVRRMRNIKVCSIRAAA